MRRTLLAAACLGVLVSASACGSGSDGSEPKQPNGATSEAKPPTPTTPEAKTADPPTVFDAGAAVSLPTSALQANVAGDVVSRFLTLRDRTGYIVAIDALFAVDVLTGEQLWSARIEGQPADPNAHSGPFVNSAGPRPPFVTDTLAAAAVPVRVPEEGTTPAYTALTVIVVDATTGAKSWQATVKVADDQYGSGGQNSRTKVLAVTDKAVIASYAEDDNALTVALDPATGEKLWERKDYDAGSLHGDVLVGTDFNVAENSSMTQATAVDVATGRQLWVGATRSYSLTLVQADPSLVVVNRSDYGSGDPFLLFLDPATGTEKAKLAGEGGFGPRSYGECLYDEQSVLACTEDGVLTGYDAKTARKLWSLPDKAAGRVAPARLTAAWHGALYGTTQGRQPIVLDAKTGKDLSTEVGAVPFWVSKYAGIGLDEDGAPKAYPVKK